MTTRIVLAAPVLACSPAAAFGQALTVGRVTGYGSTRGNTTIYEDAKGQQTGRAERRKDGTTIYDSMGRQVGTARERR